MSFIKSLTFDANGLDIEFMGGPVRNTSVAFNSAVVRLKRTGLIDLTTYEGDTYEVDAATVSTPSGLTPDQMFEFLKQIGRGAAASVCYGSALFQFESDKQAKSFHRIDWIGDFTAVTLNNVAPNNYSIWKNNVLVTPLVFPLSLTQGDTLYFDVVPTDPLQDASLTFDIEGVGSVLKYASDTTYPPRSHHNLQHLVAFPNFHLKSDASVRGDGTILNDVNGVIWDTPATGDFEILFRPSGFLTVENANSVFGLNDLSGSLTPAPRLNRIRYGISTITYNNFRVYESGVLRISVATAVYQWQRAKIEVIAGTVKYYYSLDDGASWVLVYTSLVPYNGTTPLYADWTPRNAKYIECHPPQFRKL